NSLDLGDGPVLHCELVHNPVDDPLQCLGFHRTTGFANGRQRPPSPVLRTDLLQRVQQETVRCADEIDVAGLPLPPSPPAIPPAPTAASHPDETSRSLSSDADTPTRSESLPIPADGSPTPSWPLGHLVASKTV